MRDRDELIVRKPSAVTALVRVSTPAHKPQIAQFASLAGNTSNATSPVRTKAISTKDIVFTPVTHISLRDRYWISSLRCVMAGII